ncbi:MAG TPA: hypothetical protein VHO24_09135 [Opitutaceae bacterium]|nr:hypothetical protein [Opitutaceae bacterium]
MTPLNRIFLTGCALLSAVVLRAAAADPVAISIATREPGAAIAPDFSGLSYETSRMLPDDKDAHYFRPDNLPLLATFRTLGVKNLRIGGNSVDASLIAIPSEADVRSFFDFAKAAGVKVIYSVRLHSGDPAAAGRVARLIRDNYADVLESFSIGNEPDYYKDYDVYRARWTSIRDAIVAEFPGAKFCGPDQNPPDARSLLPGAAQNLYQNLVRDFANESGRLTQVTLHSYPFGCSYRNPRDGTEDVLKLIPADAAESREKMLSPSAYGLYEKIRQATTASIAGAPVSLRLTETNSYWYSGLKGASDSYAAALWAVDYLHWWATHGAVGVNFHTGDKTGGSIMLPCRYAAFVTSGAGYEVRPLGYGMKLFSLGGQGRSLPVSVASAATPHIAAYATLVDEATVTITLINKEHGAAAAAQSVLLKLDTAIGAEAQIITLATPDHDIAASAASVTLGGAPIEKDGTWRGQWTALPVSPVNNREIAVTLSPASAAVIKAKLVRPSR